MHICGTINQISGLHSQWRRISNRSRSDSSSEKDTDTCKQRQAKINTWILQLLPQICHQLQQNHCTTLTIAEERNRLELDGIPHTSIQHNDREDNQCTHPSTLRSPSPIYTSH